MLSPIHGWFNWVSCKTHSWPNWFPLTWTVTFSQWCAGDLLLFSCQVVSNSLWPHELQHTRVPYPSPSLEVCPSSCPSNRLCHPTITSSVALFFAEGARADPCQGSWEAIAKHSEFYQQVGTLKSAQTEVLTHRKLANVDQQITAFGPSHHFLCTQTKTRNLVWFISLTDALRETVECS